MCDPILCKLNLPRQGAHACEEWMIFSVWVCRRRLKKPGKVEEWQDLGVRYARLKKWGKSSHQSWNSTPGIGCTRRKITELICPDHRIDDKIDETSKRQQKQGNILWYGHDMHVQMPTILHSNIRQCTHVPTHKQTHKHKQAHTIWVLLKTIYPPLLPPLLLSPPILLFSVGKCHPRSSSQPCGYQRAHL